MKSLSTTAALLLVTACLALHGLPAQAQSTREQARDVKADLQARAAQEKQLENESRKLGGDLEDAREKLVALARDIQNNQQRMDALEGRMTELADTQKELEARLLEGRKSTAHTLMALERMRRIPPAALLLQPETPLRTAQTAMLLREVLPPLQARAAEIRADMKKLDDVKSTLLSQRRQHELTSSSLLAEQKSLQSLLVRKEDLFRKTRSDLEEERKAVRALAEKSQNLAELIEKMDSQARQAPIREKARMALQSPARNLPNIGAVRWPLKGPLRTRFQEPDHLGSPSMGLSIEGRPGALVIAPMDGVVRFAGPFKNYGNLVILEHKSGYHSLIAGLGKITTGVGHSVSAGEPVGELRRGESSESPALYYELRYNGKAIDPALKLAALDS